MYAFSGGVMDREDIKYYEKLYLNVINKENSLDYIELLNLYKFYLCCFIDESESFYMDADFLHYVVNGFTYYHNMIFVDEKILDSDSSREYFCVEHYEKLYNEGRDREWTTYDLISAATYLVNSKLLKEELAESEIETVKQLIDNNEKVNKVMRKRFDSTS